MKAQLLLAIKQQTIRMQKKGFFRQQPRDKRFEWRNKHPQQGAAHSKTVQGKEYIYCPHHRNCWVPKINNEGQIHADSCEARSRS